MASVDLPSTMYAWRGSTGGKTPFKEQIPIPDLAPGKILVKVLASGVCHSDCFLLAYTGQLPGFADKFTMGHEGSGVVVKIGAEAGSSFQVGQKVAILCTPGCNKSTCGECSRGLQRICATGPNPGLGSDGVFAQYVAVSPWGIVPIPEGVAPEIAAVSADAVLTAYHAVKSEANVKPGQTVVVIGLGGVGFNALQTALHLGAARVIVVDQRREVLEAAVKLGVAKEDAICPEDGVKLEEKVAVEGILVDSVIDFVGSEQTFVSGQLSVRPAGTLVLVGLMGQQLPLIAFVGVTKSLDIKGSFNGTREELVECLDLIAKGVIKPQVETGNIDDLPRVLEDLDAGKIKGRMVLLPNAS